MTGSVYPPVIARQTRRSNARWRALSFLTHRVEGMEIELLLQREKRLDDASHAIALELRILRQLVSSIRDACQHDMQHFGSAHGERMERCSKCLLMRGEND